LIFAKLATNISTTMSEPTSRIQTRAKNADQHPGYLVKRKRRTQAQMQADREQAQKDLEEAEKLRESKLRLVASLEDGIAANDTQAQAGIAKIRPKPRPLTSRADEKGHVSDLSAAPNRNKEATHPLFVDSDDGEMEDVAGANWSAADGHDNNDYQGVADLDDDDEALTDTKLDDEVVDSKKRKNSDGNQPKGGKKKRIQKTQMRDGVKGYRQGTGREGKYLSCKSFKKALMD
jgi:hypothetical protein